MTLAIIQVLGGFVLLVWGADRLVAGASATARNMGISPLIVGLTVVGFGTSAPEMVVSAVAALQGNPGLAVGNAVGSNIANIGLILGVTAMFYPLKVESSTLKREYPILIAIMVLVLVLTWDLHLGRSEGIFLLLALVGLISAMVWLGIKRGDTDPLASDFEAEIPADTPTGKALFWLLVGLIVLPLSSRILVTGAVTIAEVLGVSDVVIGLTVIAIGTSLPELAAALASALKKEDDLAVGNIIGSNMFNLLGVLGVAATLSEIEVAPELIHRDMLSMWVFTLLIFFMAYGWNGPGRVRRSAGVLLLALFVTFQTAVLWQALS